jgi:hypothetical protein
MPGPGERFHDGRRAAIERVLHSAAFSRSDTSRLLLKFIVEKSLAGDLDSLKEYTIATEALGRPPDFDPKADSIVRIQVQRLRKRLEEYYGDEGRDDPVRIVIPSGHYIPEFRTHPEPGPPKKIDEPLVLSSPDQSLVASSRELSHRFLIGLVVVLLGAVVIMGLYLSRAFGLRASAKPSPLPSSLDPLWQVFVPPNAPPLIVYSNAMFLTDDYGDVYRVSLSSAHPLPSGAKIPSLSGLENIPPVLPRTGNLRYFDLYTGTGEVVAAGKIAGLLGAQKQDFSVERSGLVSYDNIRAGNVIFLGSSAEDAVLEKLPIDAELVFDLSGEDAVIRDRGAAPGQPRSYQLGRDPKTGEYQTDYALLNLLPSVDPGRYVMVLAGITTLGTQAAAEFATSPAQMATLENMRAGSRGPAGRSPYFQSLLEVQIRNGAIARISCLLVRELRHK